MQKMLYDGGGYLQWSDSQYVDGWKPKVAGISSRQAVPARLVRLPRHHGPVSQGEAAPGAGRRRVHPVVVYAGRRILAAVLTLFVASLVIFATTSLLPGDAAVAALGKQARPEVVELARHRLGLDKPAPERYVDWLGGVLHGDLGDSVTTGTPVGELIHDRVMNSAYLMLVTAALLIPLSLVLGAFTGMRADTRADRFVMFPALLAISLPEFVVGYRARARVRAAPRLGAARLARADGLQSAGRPEPARAAGDHAARREPGADDPPGARRRDRGAPQRVRADGAAEGREWAAPDTAARAPQRPRAGRAGARPGAAVARRRHRRDRAGLRLPGRRQRARAGGRRP